MYKLTLPAAALLILFGATGCATESAVERDFGNSVRHMVQQQTAHPDRFVNPDLDPVDGTDGIRIESVLDSYRKDVTTPGSLDSNLELGTD